MGNTFGFFQELSQMVSDGVDYEDQCSYSPSGNRLKT